MIGVRIRRDTVSSPRVRPIVFINLWPKGGMKHYSDALVGALSPAAPVIYVRNYPSDISCESFVVALGLNPLRNLFPLAALAWKITRLRPVAIHLNNDHPALLPLYPLFAFFNSVITIHDARSHEGESLAKRVYHRVHLALVAVFIRKVIVHSEAIRLELPRFFSRKTVSIVPHVNYAAWRQAAAKKSSGNVRFTVLFFGRILEYKGLAYLLESFASLDPERFELVIAGEGDLSHLDVSRSNFRVVNRFITDAEMRDFFAEADAVALPYISASQSSAAYMAFAFGKPVIATRVGALPDAVLDGVNGLLVEPGSAAALADAIRCLADPALHACFTASIKAQNLSSDAEIRAALFTAYHA